MAINFKSYTKTMALRSWLTLVVFCLLTLAGVELSQQLLLQSSIDSSRLDQLQSAGHQIRDELGLDPNLLEDTAFNHGWRIMILDHNLEVVERQDGFDVACRGFSLSQLGPLSEFTLAAIDRLVTSMSENGEAESSEITTNTSDDVDVAVFMIQLDDPAGQSRYLYISSVILVTAPLQEILSRQFFVAALIALALAAVLAYLVTRLMTRPIVDLTRAAQRLAHGDFTTKFDGRGFTETEQLAKTLNYAAHELREVDTSRKELLANVSHDLKTPLTIIEIYAETIRDVSGDNPVKRQAHCETIIGEANRLTDMVNEIVELSRLESGAESIVVNRVDLAQSLRETLASFAILAETRYYQFDVEAVDEAPIIGNEHYMRRALYNLIGNAINYTGPDRYVGVRLTTADGHVRFVVTDHGPGISTDKIATIWDRYHKSGSSHKRTIIGSGIGLSIVRRVLTLHQAKFGVISEPDQGSSFWFEMTLTTEPDPSHPSA
ncbi:MAG: HAMP domain-containing histidine kinase [Propionibacteriaceae bacterium]|jgi:signal transduction histidine kinase|nr:HAMP domain-containing histidine kinase [Propionibacteriaceae bacterium]